VFARINNVFDRRYFNFGVVGENFFTGPDHTFGPIVGLGPAAEQFRGPGGAPCCLGWGGAIPSKDLDATFGTL
jgi:hypothetical protein